MSAYYGSIPLHVNVNIGSGLTEKQEDGIQKEDVLNSLYEVISSEILGCTEDEMADYDIEYEGDGSFSFSSRVKMLFDYGETPGYWNDETGGEPPDAWCDMDLSSFNEKEMASCISGRLPNFLKGLVVKVNSTFDDMYVDLDPEPAYSW